MPPRDSRAEVATKISRVAAFAAAHGCDAIGLRTRGWLGWLSAGARLHVRSDAEQAEALAIVTRGGEAVLLANAIEAPRFATEEIAGLPFELVTIPWPEPLAVAARRLLAARGCDPAHSPSEPDLPPALAESVRGLRSSFLPDELARYRGLCLDSARALEAAARSLTPGMTEHAAAAAVAAAVTEAGCLPGVVLVAFDERIQRYRHPLPTGARLQRRAMLVLCAERGGQVAALTRFAGFGAPAPEIARRMAAAAEVDAAAIRASRPGTTAGEVFAAITAAYDAVGFPDEWRLHHQGGAIGYAPREWIAAPNGTQVLQETQPCAWNPSIAGAKSEDTILVTAAGPVILTTTGDWPSIPTPAGPRPAELRIT